MSDMATEYTPRQFTVEEYHRLADLGVFGAGERLELLDGIIVEMSPIGPRHWARHARIVRYLHDRIGAAAVIAGQGAFPLGVNSEPQPDIAVLAPRDYEGLGKPPGRDDFLLLIELADSSLRKDLGPKLRLYARSGIADYVVIDFQSDALLHFSEPHELGYAREERLGHGDTFELGRLPGITLEAGPFLGSGPA